METIEIVPYLTIENNCRICLKFEKSDRLISISQSSEDEKNNSLIWKLFNDLKISVCRLQGDDNLPKNICADCFHRLADFSDFQQMFERSNKIILQFFNKTKNDTGGEELEFLDVGKVESLSMEAIDDDDQVETNEVNKNEEYLDENFDDQIELEEEEQEDDVEKPTIKTKYNCEVCKGDFSTKKGFHQHKLRNGHYKEDEIDILQREIVKQLCNRCGDKIEDDLMEHQQLYCSVLTSLTCRYCEEVKFKSIDELTKHFDELHPPDKPFACNYPKCGKHFAKLDAVRIHSDTHNTERSFTCSICDKAFHREVNLKAHIQTHKLEVNVCPHCGKSFPNKLKFKLHLRIHKTEKFKCSHCDREFLFKIRLTQHERIHTDFRPYACTVCEKRFTTQKYLSLHMETHQIDRPHSCHICAKAYRQRTSLNSHMKSHNKSKPAPSTSPPKPRIRRPASEKPFKCDQCAKDFSSKLLLKLHMECYHSDVSFVCPQCNLTFKSKFYLDCHVKRHTNTERRFACDLCGDRFKSRAHLQSHTEIVHLKITYECEVCGKPFKTPGNRKIHIRDVHGIKSEERPFKCNYCAKDYVLEIKLEAHMQKYHADHIVDVQQRVYDTDEG